MVFYIGLIIFVEHFKYQLSPAYLLAVPSPLPHEVFCKTYSHFEVVAYFYKKNAFHAHSA